MLYESDEVAAADLFERLFDQHGADPAILLVRAHMYAEMGKFELADADFRRAADLTRDQLDRFLETDWWAIGTYPDRELATAHPPENDPDPSRPPAVAEGAKALRWLRVPVQALGQINLVGSLKSDNVSDYLA